MWPIWRMNIVGFSPSATARCPTGSIRRRSSSPGREASPSRDTAQTARLSEDYFRTCIRRDDERRYFCFFIDTSRERVAIDRDPSALPNRINP